MSTISLDLDPVRPLPAPAIGQTCLLRGHTGPLSAKEAPTRTIESMSHAIELLYKYDLRLCESGPSIKRRKSSSTAGRCDTTEPRALGSTPQDLPAALVPEPRFTILLKKEAKRTFADPNQLKKPPSSPKKSGHYSTSPLRCSSVSPSSSASCSLNSFRDPLIAPFPRGYQPVFR